ncbi:MAG: DUF4280 domain-containing protein [Roseburia sp.]|nr:DUF4280 domain-containing protein [Roseburia sp.]
MGKTSYKELENKVNDAYEKFANAYDAQESATKQREEAEQKRKDALNQLQFGGPTQENLEAAEKAEKEFNDAKKAEEDAQKELENTAEEAQQAQEEMEKKKDELRNSRSTDTTYVVHCASIECSCGMRESLLVLGASHGVKTRQVPQITVKDYALDKNIINFGGCTSMENPKVKEAAENAAKEARKAIKEKETFMDKVINFFTKADEIEVEESLMEQCIGECIATFPANAKWEKGHEKVFVNGESVLLRKCDITCDYGGLITIIFSGQPE